MRNLKRFLSMALTMLMVAACLTGIATNATFDDVYDHSDAIETLEAIGVAKGDGNGNFLPDELVQRYQAALFFTRIMTGEVADGSVYEQQTTNYSQFKDCDEYYPAAISYAASAGIILGYPDGTFGPTDGIEYQQALTMALRALGTEVTAADYPFIAVEKAKAAGLTADLDDVEALDSILTRAQMAQIQYNLLLAKGADGKTFAEKSFGIISSTFVLTATPNKNLTDDFKIAATGYIGLSVLNYDGTYGKTFYVKQADILTTDEIANVDNMVGFSFKIIGSDGLKNIYLVKQNPSKLFESEAIGYNDAAQFVLDDVNYTLSTTGKFTQNLWNADVKNTSDENEFILFLWNTTKATTAKSLFLYDANYNLVDANGNILLYRLSAISGTTFVPYVEYVTDVSGTIVDGENQGDRVVNGVIYTSSTVPSYLSYGKLVSGVPGINAVYTAATANDVANAVSYIGGTSSNGYELITDREFITASKRVAADPDNGGVRITGTDFVEGGAAPKGVVEYGRMYDELLCFDDNNDGKYDRGIYTAFNFGTIEWWEGNGHEDGANIRLWHMHIFEPDSVGSYEGNVSLVGQYNTYKSVYDLNLNYPAPVVYAMSEDANGNRTMNIKKFYDVKTGVITSFDIQIASSNNIIIGIDGTEYLLGSSKDCNNFALFGIINPFVYPDNDVAWLAGIYGQYVDYVVEGNTIIWLNKNPGEKEFFVLEDVRAVTTNGLLKVSGYFNNLSPDDILKNKNAIIRTFDIEYINEIKASTWMAMYGTDEIEDLYGKLSVLQENLGGTYSLYMLSINEAFKTANYYSNNQGFIRVRHIANQSFLTSLVMDNATWTAPMGYGETLNGYWLPDDGGFLYRKSTAAGPDGNTGMNGFATNEFTIINGQILVNGQKICDDLSDPYCEGTTYFAPDNLATVVYIFVSTTEDQNNDNIMVTDVKYSIGTPLVDTKIEYKHFVFINAKNNGDYTFVYVYGAENADDFTANTSTATIYYFDRNNTKVAYQTNSLYGIRTQYKYLFNLKTGKFDDTVTFYNTIGAPGRYYYVRNSEDSTVANYPVDITEQLTLGYLYSFGVNGAYVDISGKRYVADTQGKGIAMYAVNWSVDDKFASWGINGKKDSILTSGGNPYNFLAGNPTQFLYTWDGSSPYTDKWTMVDILVALDGTRTVPVLFWDDAVQIGTNLYQLSIPTLMMKYGSSDLHNNAN